MGKLILSTIIVFATLLCVAKNRFSQPVYTYDSLYLYKGASVGKSLLCVSDSGTVFSTHEATGTTTGWALTGNSGTNPSTNFIGTTDAKNFL